MVVIAFSIRYISCGPLIGENIANTLTSCLTLVAHPSIVICKMQGVPDKLREKIVKWK